MHFIFGINRKIGTGLSLSTQTFIRKSQSLFNNFYAVDFGNRTIISTAFEINVNAPKSKRKNKKGDNGPCYPTLCVLTNGFKHCFTLLKRNYWGLITKKFRSGRDSNPRPSA